MGSGVKTAGRAQREEDEAWHLVQRSGGTEWARLVLPVPGEGCGHLEDTDEPGAQVLSGQCTGIRVLRAVCDLDLESRGSQG